jgi:hypothetical protein
VALFVSVGGWLLGSLTVHSSSMCLRE